MRSKYGILIFRKPFLLKKIYGAKKLIFLSVRCRRLEGYPLQVRHKQNWGRAFIVLLPQAAVLPGSDAGSDVVKPASSFVIQNRQTSCSMWWPMYGAVGHAIRMWSAVCSEASHSQFGEGTRPHLCIDEWINRSYSWQAHLNRPGTGPGYKNTEPDSIFIVAYSAFHLWFVH